MDPMRIFVFLLLVVAVWYGWKQYPKLVERRPSHEAVIENQTGSPISRIRVRVGGQTLVQESLPAGERATLPFRVREDSRFELTWEGRDGERSWSGGMVPAGPMVQRHEFLIDAEGQVLYRAENK
jgi:hypothetical protein